MLAPSFRSRILAGVLLFLGMGLLTACQTLREAANLKNVRFRIDRVSDTRLVGIRLGEVNSYNDLSGMDVTRLGSALLRGELPLSLTLHVSTRNPEGNGVDARLTKMDWTLLLQDRETISGTFDREVVLEPGAPSDVPIRLTPKLIDFFDENLRGLVDVATAVVGEGPPQNVKLEVQPTIQTRGGPMEYPKPITVVSEDVGAESGATK